MPTALYTIRPMQADDYAQVAQLWRNTAGMGMSEQDDNEQAITAFLAFNPDLNFVAVQGGQLLGVIMCGYDGRRATIYHMAVAQNVQGKGIGTALLQRLEQQLAQQQISKARLLVFADNQSGNAFWAKQGWTWQTALNYYSKDFSNLNR
ncbi:GNAT family N-acetyltransferase [Pasteurellaceae bacterium USgator11]|nr:GNAT family N-acetyltransferase [Pasteurellaceae bacterium UScroc12]TNG97798.1 GNAT family N-acetyltransferase [Pasteurellaceae bacterium USgator41]TNG99163.1 GNAT family N-acetyltransferase [Pasteurellaceae bacterium UScroc31]TNH03070.1 GNAT family N-acetyltransferase [Pasteurellaceae bacterium USgator11]